MLLVLSGLPGVGKTTIARVVASRLRAVHVRIDSIEEAIRQAHPMTPIDEAGYRVGYAIAEDNLRLGHVVVADSVNPWPLTRDAWRSVAIRAGVAAVEIEIVCSDASEHRRRVEQRLLLPGARGPSWNQVVTRDYRPWTTDRIVIDTAHAQPSDCVEALLASIPPSNAARGS